MPGSLLRADGSSAENSAALRRASTAKKLAGRRRVAWVERDESPGKRLSEARGEAHISQRTLAAQLGVSVRTVQNYEAGRFVPYRHLDALSRLLQRPSAWLLYGHEDPETEELIQRSRAQRDRRKQNLEQLRELREELAGKCRALEAHAR